MANFENVNVSPDQDRLVRLYRKQMNETVATMLRQIKDLHETSWNDHTPPDWNGGQYTKSWEDCTREVCGEDNPLCLIMDCVFANGTPYDEVWTFCDMVLGNEQ